MSAYSDTILPREGRALPRWAIAALIVLAAHLAVGAYIILTRSIEVPAGAPADTVMIDLAPVATSASQPQAAPQQEVAKPEPTPPPPPETPPPPSPEPPPTVPEMPPVMATPLPVAQPIPPILQTPELPPAKQTEAVVPPPAPPKPVPEKQLEKKRIEQERLRKARAERVRKERAARARAAAQASRAAHAAGPAPGASRQSLSSWASEVQARVNGAKRYPEAARARGESGTATLAFSVDASGRVVSASIVGSSGSAALDRETLSMVHRLGRLPPPPTNGRVTLRVSVNFSMF